MTVRELINKLLDKPMDNEVLIVGVVVIVGK